MKAQDVMKSPVITVQEDTDVTDLIALLLKSGVSGAPVVDADGRIVGIVSEGDLLRRPELGTDHKPKRWLDFFTGTGTASDFIKVHGITAAEIMCSPVITVNPEQDLNEVVTTMEVNGVKRVPVISNGVPVGIVARADLLQALAALRAPLQPQQNTAQVSSDRDIRAEIQQRMKAETWSRSGLVNAIVQDGNVSLWGVIDDESERKALRRLVEEVPGVKDVEDRCVRAQVYYG